MNYERLFRLILLAIGTFLLIASKGQYLYLMLFAAFMFAVAATSFIDATYRDLQGNSTEVDIRTEPILGFLSSVGLKGRYSTAAAILFASFTMLALLSIVGYKLTPHSVSEALQLAGIDKPDQEVMDLGQSWNAGPPKGFEIAHDGVVLGRITSEELIAELRRLAEKGIEESATPALTKAIYEECRGSNGLCRVSKLYKVNVSFSRELDSSSRQGGVIANICPSSSENGRFIREELFNGAKLRVHPTKDPGASLLASTPFIENNQVGQYDPFPLDPRTGSLPPDQMALAKRACLGSLAYIQLPASYQSKPFAPADKDGFTIGFLTLEKQVLTQSGANP